MPYEGAFTPTVFDPKETYAATDGRSSGLTFEKPLR